jgi:hypothetical protein
MIKFVIDGETDENPSGAADYGVRLARNDWQRSFKEPGSKEREIKKLIFMYSAADPREQETKLNHITKAASGEGAAFDFPENGAAWRKGANFTLRGGGYLLY